MEVARSSEILVPVYQNTRRDIRGNHKINVEYA
jgi:hypothetical protein